MMEIVLKFNDLGKWFFGAQRVLNLMPAGQSEKEQMYVLKRPLSLAAPADAIAVACRFCERCNPQLHQATRMVLWHELLKEGMVSFVVSFLPNLTPL